MDLGPDLHGQAVLDAGERRSGEDDRREAAAHERLDLHDLGFLLLQDLVDLLDVQVGQLLHLGDRVLLVVLADLVAP